MRSDIASATNPITATLDIPDEKTDFGNSSEITTKRSLMRWSKATANGIGVVLEKRRSLRTLDWTPRPNVNEMSFACLCHWLRRHELCSD